MTHKKSDKGNEIFTVYKGIKIASFEHLFFYSLQNQAIILSTSSSNMTWYGYDYVVANYMYNSYVLYILLYYWPDVSC